VALNSDEWEHFKSLINTIDMEYRRVNSKQIETIPILDIDMIQQKDVMESTQIID